METVNTRPKPIFNFTGFILKPRFILLALAFLNLIAVPLRYSSVCFYNWDDALGFALLLFLAALSLWLSKWWGYVFAALMTAPMVYRFSYVALKVHGILPAAAQERELFGDAKSWRQFVIWNYPEVLLQNILAVVILSFAIICLMQSVFLQRLAFRAGG